MAKYLQIGNKFYTAGEQNRLEEVRESDVIGRAGDIAGRPTTIEFLKQRGDVLKIDKPTLVPNPFGGTGFIIAELGREGLAGTVPYIRTQAEAQALGATPPSALPAGSSIPVNQDFSQYLKETGQSFSPQTGFGGTGSRTLGVDAPTGGQVGQVFNVQYLRQRGDDRVFAISSDGGAYYVDYDFAVKNNVFPQVQEVDFRIDTRYPLSGPISNMPEIGQGSADINTIAQQALEQMQQRGFTINPQANLDDPLTIAEFLRAAEAEVEPGFQETLRVARGSLLRDIGFSLEQQQQFEQQLEQQYGEQFRGIGTEAAERGLALSGQRVELERRLAEQTQQEIEGRRRQLGFVAGGDVLGFAQQFGSQQVPTAPTLAETRVLPGQATFQQTGRQLPFYELSPELIGDIVGEQPRQKALGIRNLAQFAESQQRLGRTLPF